MMISLKSPSSAKELAEYYDFRWHVLRKPWSQPPGSERDELDAIAEHIAAYDRGVLVGVGRLHYNTEREGQLRYMATAEHIRGQGVGGLILEHLEAVARAYGCQSICLNARQVAVGFYQRYGYGVIGQGATLFNQIHHVIMRKAL